MLTWTKTGRDERGWQANGANGRRYQIEMRNGYVLLPIVDGLKRQRLDTLEDAQAIAWGFEVKARIDDKLAMGAR